MKKFIKPAILFVGSFLVVNAAMFGFLTLTRPPLPDETAAADSTAADSIMVEQVATADSAQPSSIESTGMVMGPPSSPETSSVAVAEPLPVAEPALSPEPAAETAKAEEVAATAETETLPVAETNPATAIEAATAISAANLPDDPAELAKLAKLLESMKPDDAAAIAARLNTDQIIALVMRMKNRNGGKMLAALPVDKAALVAARMSETAARGKNGS